MDFARKQLEKYGWKEGQGLGKNEDGISQPIKPKLKFDNAGVGHDHGAEFTNKWWETLFNSATQNIDIKVKDEKVRFVLKSEPIEITTKNYSLKKNDKNALEKSFLRTSKLTNQGIENYHVPIIHENPKKFSVLTDEELFAACGGRTAHKGARHGLKLSGKLSRIEKQEKMLLKKMKMISLDDESKVIRKMRKLQSQRKKVEFNDINDSVEPVSDSSCSSIKKKKKKSKKNVSFNDTVVEYYIPSTDNNANFEVNPNGGEGDAVNSDEGIEQDIEDKNNNQEDDDHKSFEEPQFVFSDLSNAERKKLKKKRKFEGKNRATSRFIQVVRDEAMEEGSSNYNCECKKRKLSNSELKCPDSKRSQLEFEAAEKLKTKRIKKKKKDKKEKRNRKMAEDQKIRNIAMSLDNVCKISDDI
ncbi:hypothetical protein WA026_023017 [Henosepilachna vigintioctopunctata]|uniref:G patch domain-containing protein 4 n=1 Tax=Henosepilachna vigintioctopunctata TaxID=420089 RepID=A0AAW1VDP2_9CUCU